MEAVVYNSAPLDILFTGVMQIFNSAIGFKVGLTDSPNQFDFLNEIGKPNQSLIQFNF